MAHISNVWRVRDFPCRWPRRTRYTGGPCVHMDRKSPPETENQVATATGTVCPARACKCKLQLASGHNFLVSNSTERSSRPSPRGAQSAHTSADQIKILARAAAPAVPRRYSRLQRKPPSNRRSRERLSSTQSPRPAGPGSPAHTHRVPGRNGASRGVTRAARFIRANHASCSLLCSRCRADFLGGCWPACLEREAPDYARPA